MQIAAGNAANEVRPAGPAAASSRRLHGDAPGEPSRRLPACRVSAYGTHPARGATFLRLRSSGRCAGRCSETGAAVRYYDLTREARREFARIATSSLLAAAESEAAELEGRRVSLRRRHVKRRVLELQLALDALTRGRELSPLPRGVMSVFRLLTVLWLLSLAELIAYVAASGIDTWTGVGDVVLLLMTCVWFAAAIGTTPDGTPDS